MIPTPIGRNVIVDVLDEELASPLLVKGLAPENMTRRCTVVAVGGKCRYSKVGDTVIARTILGTKIGGHLLLPETACLAVV